MSKDKKFSTRKATGCVIVRDNSILLLHRIDKDWWEVPGGKSEEDESLEQTAKREAREELGIDVRIIRKLGRTKFNNFQFDLDYAWFLAEIINEQSPKIGEPNNSAGNLATEIEKGRVSLL